MKKMTAMSGFPEWTPEQRLLEMEWLSVISRQFTLFGFLPIETRAVEPLSVLLKKGDDKEIYVLKRLHDDGESKDTEEGVGLHFDLTVPFARYVLEHEHLLTFPFKRYQIQKVWRGERKQEGRYREFYQCDIDIIAKEQLPLSYDAELPVVLLEVMSLLPVPPVIVKINNRKLLEGFYRGLGIHAPNDVLRIVDKVAKIGPLKVIDLLKTELSLSELQAEQCVAFGRIQSRDLSFVNAVKAFGIEHPLLTEGLDELSFVLSFVKAMGHENIEVDLSIARGLDYYTGTVYEGYLVGHEHIGAVCSGGRYDNLAEGARQPLPGIGVSIGITRLLGYLFGRQLLAPTRASLLEHYVILKDESQRVEAFRLAQMLRKRGMPSDVHPTPQNFGKQMKVAEKKGARFVWFCEEGGQYSVKDLVTGVQCVAHPQEWIRPESTA